MSSAALDQLDRVALDATQDQRALVRGEREAKPEIGLSAAGLPAVEHFIGGREIGLRLRSRGWESRSALPSMPTHRRRQQIFCATQPSVPLADSHLMMFAPMALPNPPD